jgi:transposase
MSRAREKELLQQLAERDARLAERAAELVKSGMQLAEREVELAKSQAQLLQARSEISLLQQKLDALSRSLFGKKSEQLNPAQLQLLFQELHAPGPALGNGYGPQSSEAQSARPAKASRSRPRARMPRVPEHLPVIEEVIVPEPVKGCPEAWRKIGEEVSERIDYEPARFLRRRMVRPKYVKRGELDAVPLIAPLPASLLERSIVTPGLLAQILVSKYCDHLPLYRQESIYWSRHQVWLPRQTMAMWVGLAADWLRAIYDEIGKSVLSEGYVQVDETPIRYLSPGHGKTKLGYLWTCHRPGADTLFSWQTSRAASCLEKIIPGDFNGIIQCDGYTAYDAFARGRASNIRLVGCWAHARRRFFDSLEQAPKEAGLVIHLLHSLYRTEEDLRETRAGPTLRARTRALASRPAIERLHHALKHWKSKHRFLPKSNMGKAIDYALGQWSSLLLYLDDGRLEIDNNLVENSIRPTAIGKKNWLFIGDANAGERGAILYTIVESCRRRGLDPYEYLRDVLTRLPNSTNWQIKDLTPEAWAKARNTRDFKAAA